MKNLLIALSATVVFSTTAFAESKCPTAGEMHNFLYSAIAAYHDIMLEEINKNRSTKFTGVSVTDGLRFQLDDTHGCNYKVVASDHDAIFLF